VGTTVLLHLARGSRILIPLLLSVTAGCAMLPASGPSTKTIVDYYHSESRKLGVTLLNVTPQAVANANAAYGQTATAPFAIGLPQPTDTIRVGDTLNVVIFQVGPGLFGTPGANAPPVTGGNGTAPGPPANVAASSVALPPLMVARNGTITVPYGGRLKVAGRTPHQVQNMIARALRHGIFEPQVVVNIQSTEENVFTVLGDVRSPGRFKIAQGERLLGGIASAGGPVHYDVDDKVTLFRHGREFTARLGHIESSDIDDVWLQAGDRIQVTYDPLAFTVFGATGRIQEVIFDRKHITLAEALARTGGPNDELADIAGVFLFRFEPERALHPNARPGGPAIPVIYHLKLSDPQSYFMMRRFQMRDRDVLYIADARAVQIKKFFAIIGQLFSPLELGARAAVGATP
jgi:polysaccharide biosynthesis/export protein